MRADIDALWAYKVQRRERPSGDWAAVATAVESEITLNGQTRAKEFEDCVVAMNKASEGEGKRRRHGGRATYSAFGQMAGNIVTAKRET